MNTLAILTLLALNVNPQVIESENTKYDFEMVYSPASYPYDLLVKRADEIKIIYTVDKQEVKCSVVLEDSKLNEKTETVVVEKKKFEEKPLASCLARDQAKQWLSATF